MSSETIRAPSISFAYLDAADTPGDLLFELVRVRAEVVAMDTSLPDAVWSPSRRANDTRVVGQLQEGLIRYRRVQSIC